MPAPQSARRRVPSASSRLRRAWIVSWSASWRAPGQVRSAAKPILEINPRHDLILALASENDPALREDAAHLLFDEARILDGELPADARAFSQRLARVMRRGLR